MNFGAFAGRVGKHPALRSTPNGQQVLNFSVAVNVGFGDRASTLWVACALWGERAAKLEPYITTGKAVTVAGDVTVRAYSSKEGEPKAELQLNVQRLTLQGGRDAGDEEGLESHAEQRGTPGDHRSGSMSSMDRGGAQRDAFGGSGKPAAPAAGAPDFDDDIPF